MKPLVAMAVLDLCILALCAPARAQSPPRQEIGILVADGDNAYVNGTRIKEKTKYRMLDGYTMATGPGTSIRLELTANGYDGYIQLDENTDPNLLAKARCVAMEMLKGRVIIHAKRICLKSPRMELVTKSLVHLETGAAGDVLTVIEGSADLEVPITTTVGAYWRYSIAADDAVQTHEIDSIKAERTIQWQQQYFRGMSTWGKVMLGILGALVLHEVIDHTHHPSPSPPPSVPSDPPSSPTPTDDR
jgi:hypothetical protein